MPEGPKILARPTNRPRQFLALGSLFLLAILLIIVGPSTATSAGEHPVTSASLSQAGTKLILKVQTSREINLSLLSRRPKFDDGKERYLCLEMNQRGATTSSQICIGGPIKTYGFVGVMKADLGGEPSNGKLIKADVEKIGKKSLVVAFDPRKAGLSPGNYTWRIADRGGKCAPTGRLDAKAAKDCLTYFPSSRRYEYRLRKILAVGCTGGNGQFVRKGPRKGRQVALTFDDGPGIYTPGVLKVLRRHNVKATFFMLGQMVANDPALARRVLAEGHEVANHSYDHPMLPSGSNIRRTTRKIKQVTGFRPCLFRPPYGAVNSRLKRSVKADRMKTVNWDVDTSDWRQPGSSAIKSAIVKRSKPGSIVLMHDAGGPRAGTVQALDKSIRGLRRRGLKLVTVTELLGNRVIYRPAP